VTPTYDDFEWTSEDRLRELTVSDTPWRYYRDTEVRIETRECTGTVRPLVGAVGGDEPPLGPLHVITAFQPDPDVHGLARMVILDNELRAAGLTIATAVGSSFDGEHCEPSRAVFGLDDAAARRWGRRFGQVAVFAWSGPNWTLLACATDCREDRPWTWRTERLPND
jgi:hypothetical protein